MEGWVKLHRSLQKWEWKKSPKHIAVFLDLLLEANHEDRKYMGVDIPRGSLTTSIEAISTRTGVSPQSVRTVLKSLKSTNELTIKTTSKYTMISITKWDDYQLDNKQTNKQLTNDQQTTNKQLTTNKNLRIKELKNERIYTSTLTPDDIINIWNKEMGNDFGYASSLGANKHLTNCIESINYLQTEQDWLNLFKKIKESDFLSGKNKQNWKVSLVWIVNYDNAIKVLNNSFNDKENMKNLFSNIIQGDENEEA